MASTTPIKVPSILLPIIDRVHQAILDNRLFAEGNLPPDVKAMATEIVQQLLCVEPEAFPRLVHRSGLFFVVEEGTAPDPPGADQLYVNVWNGSRWITVDTIVLPPPLDPS